MSDLGNANPHPTVVADQSEVLAFLGDERTFGLTAPVQRIDTHGAIVFLAGQDVYKVKRAVRFPFMDFSTLERRRAACQAEIAVNRANAPGIYLAAVPITRGAAGLSIGGPGEAVEWAVHMRRFDEQATLDRLADRAELSPDLIRKLAAVILRSHARAPRRDGEAATVALGHYLDQNEAAFAAEPGLFDVKHAKRLAADARASLVAVYDLLLARGQAGHVRRCHGDLHLRNIALIPGATPGTEGPVLFDAVEFDDGIATGDVLYDLAFLLMDLEQRGLRWAANALLNRYLWGGDEAHLTGLAALPIFLSIRSAIRAKVVAAGIDYLHAQEREPGERDARRYFASALEFLGPVACRLVAIGGLSGTGKSTLAAELAPFLGRAPGAVVLRSDIERKRLFGVAETERLPAHAYSAAVTRDVYERLRRQASSALRAGQSVVVDAVHAEFDERRAIERLGSELGVPFIGLWLEAPTAVRLERISARTRDASDADATIATSQESHDIGRLDWPRLDVSGGVSESFKAARRLLGVPSPDDL
jgi:aminoglycoside phosphotransferase family enzyme/predicted kinase